MFRKIPLKLLLCSFVTSYFGGATLPVQASFSALSGDLLQDLKTIDRAAFGPGKGTVLKMRVQDSTVDLPMENVFIARNDVSTGPSDAQFIYAEGRRQAIPIDGNFTDYNLYPNRLTTADSISVYGNLRVGSDLFQNDLIGLLEQYPTDLNLLQSAGNYVQNTHGMPLYYYAKGSEMANAYYTRFTHEGTNYRLMNLGYYAGADGVEEYTAQQPDIIWHELGHAMVDAARPDLFNGTPQAGAFHEAWGDTNAMFTLLSRGGVRERVLYDTRGDLHQDNFVANVAEKFGRSVLNSAEGLRDLDDDVKDEASSSEVHDKSRVLAGVVYDVVVKAYDDHKRMAGSVPAQALKEVADFARSKWVYTLTQVDDVPSFTDIGTLWSAALPEAESSRGYTLPWKSYVREEFSKRGVVFDGEPDPWDWSAFLGKIMACHLRGEHDHRDADVQRVKALLEK